MPDSEPWDDVRMRTFDDYLEETPEPQRATLEQVRAHVHRLFPEVEETFAYGVPAFRVDGVVVGGLAARKAGCSWYPMSGSLLDAFDDVGLTRTIGALHFPADAPLPAVLVERLIRARLALR